MNKNELGKTIEDFGVWMQEMTESDVTDLAKEETPATIEDFALKLKALADEMSDIVDTMRIEAKKNKTLTDEFLGKSVAVGEWIDVDYGQCKCSLCGRWSVSASAFCRHCGARMKKGE